MKENEIQQMINNCENKYNELSDKYPESEAIKLFANNETLFNEFYLAPASAKYHGNWSGGLFCHSVLVAERILDYTFTYPNLNENSLVTVALLHDIGKLGEIDSSGNIIAPYYKITDEGFKGNWNLPQHIILSQYNLHVLKVDLTYDEYMAISAHNGAYEEANRRNFMGKESELMCVLHWADMHVARFLNI